jgi:hypothetical protein
MTGRQCNVANQTALRIIDLFSYCPEVSIEYGRTLGRSARLLYLEQPNVLYARASDETWIQISVERQGLRSLISAPTLLTLIDNGRGGYSEVRAEERTMRTFESAHPVTVGPGRSILQAIRADVSRLNLFTHMDDGEIHFSIPVQHRLPIPLPQVTVLYSLLFWLGSLVRYDPHSVLYLMDSSLWILFDGFMSQSRLWLLELMEWAFFQTQTRLTSVR